MKNDNEKLNEAIDDFGQDFQIFADELFSPPGTPPDQMLEGQDPYGDLKSTQEIEHELKGHSQALSIPENSQCRVNINRGNEQQASQPPSDIKQFAHGEISLRPNYTVNPKTFIVGESSSSAAKEPEKKKVTFVIGEKPITPWEKEYFDFAKTVYSLNQGETYLKMSEKNSIYPRITCVPKASLKFVKK